MAPPYPPKEEESSEKASGSNHSRTSVTLTRPGSNCSLASVDQSSALSPPSAIQRNSLPKRNVSDKLLGLFTKFEGGKEPRVREDDSDGKQGTNTLNSTSSHSCTSVSNPDATSLSSYLPLTPDVRRVKQAPNSGQDASKIFGVMEPASTQLVTPGATKKKSHMGTKISDRVTKFDMNPLDGTPLNPLQLRGSDPLVAGLTLVTSDLDNTNLPLSPSHASKSILEPRRPASTQLVTPLATKKKSHVGTKISDRVTKFDMNPLDGTPLNTLQLHASDPLVAGLTLETSGSDNTNLPLSPLHASKSVPTRKRSVRHKTIEIKARVFDSPVAQLSGESMRVLLSPQEVRELVKSSKTNDRLDKLLYRYEHLSEEESKDRQRLAAKIAARERRRRLGTNPANSEARRLAWEQSVARFREKAVFGCGITDSSPPLCCSIDANDEGRILSDTAIPNQVRAITYDFSDFKPPSFPKTETQRKLILEAVKRDFLFAEFRENGKARTEGSLDALIDAFEPICRPALHVLLHRGDEEGNDKLYILESGTIDLLMDGVSVGRLENVGESYGQLALMYHTPSNVTISVGVTSEGQGSNEGVKLLRLDQRTYRGLLHEYSKKAYTEKQEALLRVDILHDLVDGDEILCSRLVSAMVRHECEQGDTFDATEDGTFFMILSGKMKAISEDGVVNEMLSAGSYFGEKTLIGSMPWRGTSASEVRIVAQTEGVFFALDKISLEQILGKGRLQNLQDMHKLAATALVKKAKLTLVLRNRMANKITEWKLKSNENNVWKVDKNEKAALYVVREGSLIVTYEDVQTGEECKKEVNAGDVFGHEQVEAIVVNSVTKFQRIGGLTTSVPTGCTASIGVLPLDEAECDSEPSSKSNLTFSAPSSAIPESEQVITADTMTPKRLLLDSPTVQLRKKLQTAVQNNLRLDQLEKIRLLGEGEFGEVWMVAADVFQTGLPELRQHFALKSQLRKDVTRGKDASADILREIQILKEVEHPQVVNVVNTYEDQESIHILMGLIPGGELWDLIHKENTQGIWQSGTSEENAQFVTAVVADTLDFIHSKNIVFRDLKPENIMIDADGYPVLVDFGFAKFCPDKTYTFVGTPNYVAPEVITSAGHNRCVDYWALGVTVYEMMTGENPFYCDGMDQVSLYHVICNDKFYPLPEESSACLMNFVDGLLEKNPTQRLGMLIRGVDDVLGHPWLGAMDLDRIRSKQWPAPWKAPTIDDSEAEDDILQRLSIEFQSPLLDDSIEICNKADTSSNFVDNVEREMSTGFVDEEFSVPLTDSEAKMTDSEARMTDSEARMSDSEAKVTDSEAKMEAETTKKKGKKKSTDGTKNKKRNVSDPSSEYQFVTPTQTNYFPIKAPRSLSRKEKGKAEKAESNNRRSALKGALRSMGIDSDDEDFQSFIAEK